MGRLLGDLKGRTVEFSVVIMRAVRAMPNDVRGWTIGKQLARSGSAIGANVWEADAALTESEFAHKISLARKECSETQYWLEVSRRMEILDRESCKSLEGEAEELAKVLGAIVRKTQAHIRSTKP